MVVLDPGHRYALAILDAAVRVEGMLTFVKREGEKYPGNVGKHPGTTSQEVLRALIDRAEYVNNQMYSDYTFKARELMIQALVLLEERAAYLHDRPAPSVEECLHGKLCPGCLHVGCEGQCGRK